MSNWREMIERPEMQAMSESHRAWQQQLQQAEMQAQAAAEAQAQRADEPELLPVLEGWRDHCADQERAIAALHEAIDMQSKTIAELRAQMSDPQRANDPPHGKVGSPEWEEAYRIASERSRMRFEPAQAMKEEWPPALSWHAFGLRRPSHSQMSDPQRADEPAQQYNGRCITCGRITDVVYAGQCCVCDVRSAMSDPPQSEQPATDTSAGAVQQRINDVCQDLVAGRTTPAQRRGLGGAVERAERIPAGSDAAVGRIARLPR